MIDTCVNGLYPYSIDKDFNRNDHDEKFIHFVYIAVLKFIHFVYIVALMNGNRKFKIANYLLFITL